MKRRDFLKKAGGVATVAAVPVVLSARDMGDLKIEPTKTPEFFESGKMTIYENYWDNGFVTRKWLSLEEVIKLYPPK